MTRARASRPPADTLVLAGLTLAATALAGVLLARGLTTWLEAVSVVTGAVCVGLTVRESVWNFPLGMVNVATFFVVFGRAGLYADAGLQVVYFVLGAIGWYLWRFGGANRTPLRVADAPRPRRVGVAASVLASWAALFAVLRATGGASPVFNGLTTAMSLGAQWLTDRKNWECWLVWIVVDAIYVPLYMSKGLHLTAALYAVFLVMAALGLLRWRRSMRGEVGPRGFEVVTA